MRILRKLNSDKVADMLGGGAVCVMPTDTIYGMHALASNQKAVERIYEIENRSGEKPFIILISSLSDLEKFGIRLTHKAKVFTEKYWPGKLSIVLPCADSQFSYLHRGKKSLAFRLPDYDELLSLLEKTGPLVSTSANPQGDKPAETIKEAMEYFGDEVDLYVDGGILSSEPSTVVAIENDKVSILRKGAVKIDEY